MIARKFLLSAGLASAAILAMPAANAELPRQIGYGSRSGMSVTVTSSRGVGTAGAVIVARYTEANAREYCVEYAGDRSAGCVARQMRETKLRPFIAADCNQGRFTTFTSGQYLFVGPRSGTNDDILPVEYDVVDLATNQVLDGTSASGYSYVLGQFKALCPGKMR